MEERTKENTIRRSKRNSIYSNESGRQKPMIVFDDVSKRYQNGVEALKHLSFRIEEGEFVFLMGSSGAGKSTLIKLILMEEHPTSGKIYMHGKNLANIKHAHIQRYRRSIGVFFQDFRLLEKKNVFQNVAFAMEITGASKAEIQEKVDITLELMGLTSKRKEYPSHLSGGEQQRVALARAIVNGPDVLIADEPTGNLDPENSQEIMDLLMKINSYGTTVLVATHEQSMANQSGKRIIRLDHGVNLSNGNLSPAEIVMHPPVEDPQPEAAEPEAKVEITKKLDIRREEKEPQAVPVAVSIESVTVGDVAAHEQQEQKDLSGEEEDNA